MALVVTKTINNVAMTLHVGCYWGEWCDVGIIQEWKGTPRGDVMQSIEMTADEAEHLVSALQAAIADARRIDAEYRADMERQSAIIHAPDGYENEF